MARTGFSQQFLDLCFHSSADGAIIATLVEVAHPDWPEPLRFCNQIKGVTSTAMNGEDEQTYPYRWFELAPPAELTENIPSLNLTVDDVDLEINLNCFQADTQKPFAITTVIIVKEDPNRRVIGPCEYEATEDAHSEDGQCVFSGTLDYGLNEMYPAHAMTPGSHLGLVRGPG